MRVPRQRTGPWVAMASLLALAACNSTSGNKVENVLDPLAASPGENQQTAAVDESVDLRAYCPKTVMRAGTETLNAYPKNVKDDDPEKDKKLRYRAIITDAVRECNYAGAALNMKVGIAGRIISGPGGETGQFPLPVRVAITQGDNLLYSQLHEIVANIPPGRPNNKFTYVDSNISIPKPQQRNVIIYVGFDDQRIDLPNAVAPSVNLKPVN